ncbi:MAG: insulinase family protein, partial [Planctomycetota bacterium]
MDSKSNHLIHIALLLALASTNLRAEEQPRAKFDYESITLPNGLQVISLEDFSCPIVAIHLWYHVGSKDENPERQGFAHMFEHMMFRGTDRLGSTDHFDLIRKTGGTCNAYTTFDQTVYTQTLPANQLNLALWLEAERMSMLKIDQKSFDTERKVVEEERRMGVNQPYGKLMEKVLPIIFPDHPYSWSTIGSIPHLRSASVPELREFWTKYYVPNNATLVVVGAVKHGEVQQLAKRNFGWIPRGPEPDRVKMPTTDPLEGRKVTIKEKNAPAPLLGLLFRGVPLSHPDAEALDLMATIAGGGESSRIYRRVVADEQSAVMALGANMGIEQNGAVLFGAILPPLGGKPSKVIDAMKEELARMQTEPVTDEELTKARNQMLRSIVTESLTVESKASALGQAAVLEGDVSRINSRLERIRSVTPEDIMRVAKKYTNLDNAVVGQVKPNLMGTIGGLLGMNKKSVEDIPITGVAETNPPPPGRPGVSRPDDRVADSPVAGLLKHTPSLDFQEATLDNGMKVVVVENHEVPFVSVTMGIQTGAYTETKPGTASTAFSMLTKGTDK